MHPDETISCLDELIQSRSILAHPFYVAWQRGELTRAQLSTYATVYYPHVAAFPGYLERAQRRATDPIIRAELANNLVDELGNPAPHSELWLDFAEEIGADRVSVAGAKPRPAVAATVEIFNAQASGDTAGAVAALYAYESQQPEVSKQKLAGLRERYGVISPKALAYFEVHAEADVRHSEGERSAIARCLADGASHESVLEAAERALDAYWRLLDGICEEAQIPK
ncbi:MAG TPA: iron-containing redox enzyme family protein [Gemmatimonadaceae bacterium]|nr:iron-containing redox enzyme family protein [Gemmatimonadaceae bacterium]